MMRLLPSPEVLVQNNLDELGVIQEWLQRKRGKKVLLKVPKRGEKRQVMQMARENASETLSRLRAEWDADVSKQTEALDDLQRALNLPRPPTRIECYDISNTQGTASTGSMVVFTKGVASKQDYRRFRIRTVEGANDYASMAEVLRRRFGRAGETAKSVDGKVNRWSLMPDLVIVDGGKGQLNAALEVMRDLNLTHLPVAGLAKQNEELYLPERSASHSAARLPCALPVQRIRDEATALQSAITASCAVRLAWPQRWRKSKAFSPQRRKALLKRFGSIEAIRQAARGDCSCPLA